MSNARDILSRIADRKEPKPVRKATVMWQILGARSGSLRLFTYRRAQRVSARYNRMTGLDSYPVRFGVVR